MRSRLGPLLLCALFPACGAGPHRHPATEVVSLAGPLPETEPAARSGRFTALTYNVAGLPAFVARTDPVAAMPFIGPLLNAYDLVLVQEDFVYHEALARDATHPHRSRPMPKSEKQGLVGDGLTCFSRLPFGELERVKWVDCNGGVDEGASDCLATKGFAVATAELAPGVSIDVYNLHCEAGGAPRDDEARAAGIAQLRAYAAEHSQDRAVIVGGDFNLHRRDPRDRALLEQLMVALGLSEVTDWLGEQRDRIDMFLFRSGGGVELVPLEWALAEEFTFPDGRDLSDHRPVVVAFRWRAAQ